MSKITLNNVADITQSTTAQTTINTNSSTIQTAFDNTLSRDGTSPNQMLNNLDMNSFQIINLPAPATNNSPARLVDVIPGGTLAVIPAGGATGTVLTKLSNADYNTGWSNFAVTGILSPTQGGTGINNSTNTITLGGNLSLSGAFNTTFTVTGTTSLTLPISGTVTALGNTTTGSGSTIVLSTGPTISSPTLTTPVINGTISGTTILTIANGGTADNGTAWTTYTPTVTAASGSFTTVSATGRFKTLGKTVFVEIAVTDTTNGTAATFVIASLPVAPVASNTYAISGFGGTGFLVAGNISASSGGVCNIFKYDGTFPLATGQNLWISGVYESA